MGLNCYEESQMVLSFDCACFGQRDIRCHGSDRLSKLVKAYCKYSNINYSDVQEVCYNYNKIDTSKTVNDLGLQINSVIIIKLKSVLDN